MFKRAVVLAVGCGALALGCGTQSRSDQQEIVENLVQAGFPRSDIQIFDARVYVGLDAEVSLEASREMLVSDSTTQEQYRTTNLVGTSITNICVNGAAFVSNAKFNQALNMAIQNYNNEALRWHMTRTTGSTTG